MIRNKLRPAGELARILSAYRPDMPIVLSPDQFNMWTFRITEINGQLVLIPAVCEVPCAPR